MREPTITIFVEGWHGPLKLSRKGVLEKNKHTHTQAPVRPRVPRSRIFDPRCQPLPLPHARFLFWVLWRWRGGLEVARCVAVALLLLADLAAAAADAQALSDPEQVLFLVIYLLIVKLVFFGVVSLF